MENHRISAIREDYTLDELLENNLSASPFEQFAKWFDQALSDKVMEPNAMVLSTASKAGFPSSRVVLLKDFNQEGFVFYTNYQSRKSQDLSENPVASLLFFWPELQRQVRIEGHIARVDTNASDAYFNSRPRESRLGALASPQSEEIPDREFLEERMNQLASQYGESQFIPRPEHWGGFCLAPVRIEFWQGRGSRMHDRLVYKRRDVQESTWIFRRLAP